MPSRNRELEPIKLRGRIFSVEELELILDCVDEFREAGRTRISREVCLALDWKQPNGWLKDRACRDVLRQLEALNILKLPPKKGSHTASPGRRDRMSQTPSSLQDYDLKTPIEEFPSNLEIIFAKGNREESLWNAIVDKHHYLGHSVAVGRSIKYLVAFETRIVAAVSFASPAWNIEPRNECLCALGIDYPLEQTINNSRFLIAPEVRVKNLASHILARVTKQVVIDWTSYYHIRPLIAETFVQPSRFEGTCYRAANWVKIGTTKGYAKRGSTYRNSQEPKDIYLYGLDSKLRRRLSSCCKNGQ